MSLEPIFKAHAVNEAELAARLGISREMVRLWRKGARRVSSDRALEIEREFNIPRHQLRPDLWSES
jgi:DNA-binding transcriptional regulator YdaS (Cro superfamily)